MFNRMKYKISDRTLVDTLINWSSRPNDNSCLTLIWKCCDVLSTTSRLRRTCRIYMYDRTNSVNIMVQHLNSFFLSQKTHSPIFNGMRLCQIDRLICKIGGSRLHYCPWTSAIEIHSKRFICVYHFTIYCVRPHAIETNCAPCKYSQYTRTEWHRWRRERRHEWQICVIFILHWWMHFLCLPCS